MRHVQATTITSRDPVPLHSYRAPDRAGSRPRTAEQRWSKAPGRGNAQLPGGRTLADLPGADPADVVALVIDGMSFAEAGRFEIGKFLGVRASTVRSNLRFAGDNLWKLIRGELDGY